MKALIATLAILSLTACSCPTTKQMTLAQKCNTTPSCKAALDKLSKDVQ